MRPSSSRFSTSSACSSTNRWSSLTKSRAPCAIACSRPSASTRSKSSPSQAKPTRCAIAIVTTTSHPPSSWKASERLVGWAERETGNLLATHAWSIDCAEFEPALRLVSALQRLWETRGRMGEGMAGFDLVFNDKRYRDADVATRRLGSCGRRQEHLGGVDRHSGESGPRRAGFGRARELGDSALTAHAWPPAVRSRTTPPKCRRRT